MDSAIHLRIIGSPGEWNVRAWVSTEGGPSDTFDEQGPCLIQLLDTVIRQCIPNSVVVDDQKGKSHPGNDEHLHVRYLFPFIDAYAEYVRKHTGAEKTQVQREVGRALLNIASTSLAESYTLEHDTAADAADQFEARLRRLVGERN